MMPSSVLAGAVTQTRAVSFLLSVKETEGHRMRCCTVLFGLLGLGPLPC